MATIAISRSGARSQAHMPRRLVAPPLLSSRETSLATLGFSATLSTAMPIDTCAAAAAAAPRRRLAGPLLHASDHALLMPGLHAGCLPAWAGESIERRALRSVAVCRRASGVCACILPQPHRFWRELGY